MIHKRPNSTAIANEAQVMYVFNKTAAFVDSKSDTELEDLVKTVRTEARKAQVTATKRNQEIMRYWEKKQEEKSKAMLKDCGCAVVLCHLSAVKLSRKMGCPASLEMREVVRFVDLQVDKPDSIWQMKMVSQKLREALAKGRGTVRFNLKLPNDTEHLLSIALDRKLIQEVTQAPNLGCQKRTQLDPPPSIP